MTAPSILIGKSPEGPQALVLKRANRHGLIAGATGTGKTVSLQVLAEALSKAGVAVFAADVKGDLSGISQAGTMASPWIDRAKELGLASYAAEAAPVVFWDLYGRSGHPVRTTVSEIGPLLLARIMDLSEAQDGALAVAFKFADDEKLLLIDLKDLRAVLNHVADNADEIGAKYGRVSAQTVSTIGRKILQLETEGADKFFGEPALALADLIRVGADGRGIVNVLAADKLVHNPRLYATFLLWLMSELWEALPEVGDLDIPKLVFFFDEAHLLFDDAPKALLDRIEQVARLIRSKGVGVYFVTQSPSDIPDIILSQLGNRIQHALHAYTPNDQKAVKAAAASFRAAPGVDVAKEIQALGVGEALVSLLDEKGAPSPVARTLICPPASRVGPVTPAERQAVMVASPMGAKYDQAIDRDSAYERLSAPPAASAGAPASGVAAPKIDAAAARAAAQAKLEAQAQLQRQKERARTVHMVEQQAARIGGNILSTVGRELVRGLMGNLRR
jgi:hypothetical protein